MTLHVAPYVGAWIETRCSSKRSYRCNTSHPTWVRGLKLQFSLQLAHGIGRTLRGCVD